MNNIRLEIYTPNGVLFNGEVSMVTLPGTKGVFTVLDKHGAIISSLSKGKIKYISNNNETATIDITGGIAEVKSNVVTVCLDTIIE